MPILVSLQKSQKGEGCAESERASDPWRNNKHKNWKTRYELI
jgi:hypothetical protein